VTSGHHSFSRLLNADWLIQISPSAMILFSIINYIVSIPKYKLFFCLLIYLFVCFFERLSKITEECNLESVEEDQDETAGKKTMYILHLISLFISWVPEELLPPPPPPQAQELKKSTGEIGLTISR